MKPIVYLAVFVAGLLGFWSCSEDTYVEPIQLTTVRGRVLFSLNQLPVRNASVKLSPTSRIIVTDSAGGFRFDSVLAGKYTVQASLTGYGTEVATVETSTGSSPLVTILLTDDRTQNRAPTSATLVAPASNSTVQGPVLTLRWRATDPNRDTLTYDVLLFQSGSATPTQSFTGVKTDSLVVSNLDYNTNYLWQVITRDGVNTVNSAVFSFRTGAFPDYSYVFARRVNGQFQIFAANATGPPAQFTREGSNWRPIASPNRQQIAYISNVDTELHLYIINADGSNAHRVTTVPIAGLSATDLSFSWSPDGTQLLYPSNNRLYAVRTDGTGLRTVAQALFGRSFAGCDWTSQGNRIAFRTTGTSVYDNEISVLTVDVSVTQSLYVRRSSRVGNPVFSTSGREIVFSADSSTFQNEQGRQLDARLNRLNLTTGVLTDISSLQTNTNQNQTNKPPGTNDLEPRFSPNGSQLIFTNTDNTGTGQRNVSTIDLDGRNRRLLFSQAEMPHWR
ncbi:MAG: carboxypeptidase-like regulatory domain-containing protein [Bacteroidetes bacterium]|nr:carboxypeptidase-like regulatory domain-containing protein [Fibrella sp.]